MSQEKTLFASRANQVGNTCSRLSPGHGVIPCPTSTLLKSITGEVDHAPAIHSSRTDEGTRSPNARLIAKGKATSQPTFPVPPERIRTRTSR